MKINTFTLSFFILFFLSCDNIEDKALKGDLAAQLRLAYCYETGDSIGIQDIEKAKFYYELAGKQGNLSSQKWLINYYESKEDAKNVYNWYEIFAKQGHKESQHTLGDYYRYSWDPVTSDTIKAIDWYQKAANQNDTLALFKMGELLIEKNVAKGLETITKAAEYKFPEACRYLGNYYSKKKDTKNAISWYEKQAEAGDPNGYYYIGKYILSLNENPDSETIINILNLYEAAYGLFFNAGETIDALSMARSIADMYELLNKKSVTKNKYYLDIAEWRLKGNDYSAAGDIYIKAGEWIEAYKCFKSSGNTSKLNKLYNLCSVNLRNYEKTTNEWLAYHYYKLRDFSHPVNTNKMSFWVSKMNKVELTLRLSVTEYQMYSCPTLYYTNRDGEDMYFELNINMNSVKSGVHKGFFHSTEYEYFEVDLSDEQIKAFKMCLRGTNQKVVINNGNENVTRVLGEREITDLRLMMEAYEMLKITYAK